MTVEIINRHSKEVIDTIWSVSKIWESCERFYVQVGKEGRDDIKVYEYDDSVELHVVMF